MWKGRRSLTQLLKKKIHSARNKYCQEENAMVSKLNGALEIRYQGILLVMPVNLWVTIMTFESKYSLPLMDCQKEQFEKSRGSHCRYEIWAAAVLHFYKLKDKYFLKYFVFHSWKHHCSKGLLCYISKLMFVTTTLKVLNALPWISKVTMNQSFKNLLLTVNLDKFAMLSFMS